MKAPNLTSIRPDHLQLPPSDTLGGLTEEAPGEATEWSWLRVWGALAPCPGSERRPEVGTRRTDAPGRCSHWVPSDSGPVHRVQQFTASLGSVKRHIR